MGGAGPGNSRPVFGCVISRAVATPTLYGDKSASSVRLLPKGDNPSPVDGGGFGGGGDYV